MIKFDPKLIKEASKAKECLLNHGVIAFPTETVMGLGVLYNDKDAYDRLNVVKERPEDKPYTLMLWKIDDIDKYGVLNPRIKRIIDTFIPGPLTILVKVKENSVPGYVHHDTGIIGIRVPTNIEAQEVLMQINMPLLVPSANKSGGKPALTSNEVKEIFGDEIDFVVSGKAISHTPSTIVDLTEDAPKVVRVGQISEEDILKVWNETKEC